MAIGVEKDGCRICGGNNHGVVLSGCRTTFGETFGLRRCELCSFVSVYPIPSEATLERYYKDTYWSKEESKKAVALDLLFKLRMLGVVRKLRSLAPEEGRVLDWGSGDGTLVRLLREHGFECFGIDPYSAKLDDEDITGAKIEEVAFPNEFFDAITCFHVLEHVKDPIASAKKALNLLKVNGVMIVEVPNIASLGFHIFRRKWQPLELPVHLNHFTHETLQKLLSMIGNTEIIEYKSFSHRVSPSALVLSLMPFFSPKRVRRKNRGHYPLCLMITYLSLQILAYPLAIMESFLGRGAVMRMYVKKTG